MREVAKEGRKEGRKEGDCSHRRECKQRKLLRVSELSRHDVSPNRGAIVRHYPPQIMEVSLSSLPPPPLPMQRQGQCSVVLVSRREDEGEERSGTGRTLHQRHLCAHTGLSSQIRTELRDKAIWPVWSDCHIKAALSLNDSKMRYFNKCLLMLHRFHQIFTIQFIYMIVSHCATLPLPT